MRGGGGGCGVSANGYSCTYTGAQINFGDLTPYLTYGGYQLKLTNLPIVKLSKSNCSLFFYLCCPVLSLGLATTYGFSLQSKKKIQTLPVPYSTKCNQFKMFNAIRSLYRTEQNAVGESYILPFCVAGFYFIYAAYASISVQGFSYQHHLPQATTAD
jgi:hypothetical protein